VYSAGSEEMRREEVREGERWWRRERLGIK